ncbi:hypothetical protein Golob_000653 [Gossypium lobatum]|uniref:Uncharacterized protein n=1 Tax=Gossypium lobatum TaxID=34289 RepID=A0A7J8N8N8_9ROSI|nr:hypothetical protein [Gossypium lobatum]
MQLLKEMGVDAYRISIAWSRIFPSELANFTCTHSFCHDLPQALEDKYGGWLDGHIRKDFALFTETCFEKFGDRVKHWITFNEPHTFAIQGYYKGNHAPGHRSSVLSKVGDPTTEPYIVAQYAIQSHATAADIYRRNYKPLPYHEELIKLLFFCDFIVGVDDTNNITPIEDALKDWLRTKYHTEYLTNLLAAI